MVEISSDLIPQALLSREEHIILSSSPPLVAAAESGERCSGTRVTGSPSGGREPHAELQGAEEGLEPAILDVPSRVI